MFSLCRWQRNRYGRGDGLRGSAAFVQAAAFGDTIILDDGVYTGPGNRDLVFYSNAVLRSANGYEGCIIDCQGSPTEPHRGFSLTDESHGTIVGLTIKNGWAAQGGVGELTMNHSNVLDNTSDGSMVETDECQISMYGCLMQGNASTYGAGALHLRYTTGSVHNSRFVSNVTGGGDGGAMSVTASGSDSFVGTLDIESCTFLSNQCTGNGSAIYAGATGFYYGDMEYGSQNLTVNITGGVGVRGISGNLVGGSTAIDCSDIHGNQSDDWVEDWLQTALMQPGNFSDAPLYCDADAGDLTLQSTSPCLAINNACNLQIGALEQGCEGATSVDDMPVAVQRTGITSAHPNPFNPQTTICFDLAARGPVTVLVYDLKGRLVRTLARQEMMEAGSRRLVWDGRDDHRGTAAAGVYLVRLRAVGAVSQTKVMMLK